MYQQIISDEYKGLIQNSSVFLILYRGSSVGRNRRYGCVYQISVIFLGIALNQYISLISNSLSFRSSFRLIRPWRKM